MKHQYLKDLRQDSCYPVIRAVTNIFVVLGYLGSVIVGMTGVFIALSGLRGAAYYEMADHLWIGIFLLLIAVVIFIITRALKECILMLADIADCVIDFRVSQDDRLI